MSSTPSRKRSIVGAIHNCMILKADSGDKGYVQKKERQLSDSLKKDIYNPKIVSTLNEGTVEIDETLKKYATQRFMPKSQIPSTVYTVLKGHSGVITNLRWHPKYGHLLLSSSLDGTSRIWSLFPNKGELMCIKQDEGVKDGRWTCDGNKILSGGLDKHVNLVDVEKGICIHSFKHNDWITSICPHPTDTSLFLSGSNSKGIVSWDTRSNKVVTEYYDNFGSVEDMTFLDKSGSSFLSSGEIIHRSSTDRGLIVWDYRSGSQLSKQIYLEGYTCTCVRKHPVENAFVAQSTAGYIALFQASKPYQLNRKKRYEGHRAGAYHIGLSFSPDGHYLVTGSSAGSLVYYDFYSSTLLKSMKVFNKSICTCAEYHPLLLSTIATGSWDGRIVILQ